MSAKIMKYMRKIETRYPIEKYSPLKLINKFGFKQIKLRIQFHNSFPRNSSLNHQKSVKHNSKTHFALKKSLFNDKQNSHLVLL